MGPNVPADGGAGLKESPLLKVPAVAPSVASSSRGAGAGAAPTVEGGDGSALADPDRAEKTTASV